MKWIVYVLAIPIFGFCAENILDEPMAFGAVDVGVWQEVFFYDCTGNWRGKWFLDGEIGSVENSPDGMQLTAGPQFDNDAHHIVLWTEKSFTGDLKIEFDYTRLDFETRCVNILYIQATGSGEGPYAKDIMEWSELRKVPAMRMYYDHMNLYHISYAAFPLVNNDPENDYVRVRRYMPEQTGLGGTDLVPDYSRTGLFKPGVLHHITVIKRDNQLAMRVSNSEQIRYFYWKTDQVLPIESGRIGLRQMYTRSAYYKNFKVSSL